MADSDEKTEQCESNFKSSQIAKLIKDAQTLTDLHPIIDKLFSLSDLKKSLLSKLNENTNKCVDELYYHCMPFDEIFSDDIICSTIQYLASPSDDNIDYMFNKLPIINKHFNKLMKERPSLYQQYKICVSLNDELWMKRKSVLVEISHQCKRIRIMDPADRDRLDIEHMDIKPMDINPMLQPHCPMFEILNLDDMNNKCPFTWYCIRKWHIYMSTGVSVNRLYSYYNNKRADRVNRAFYPNDFSGYISPTDSFDLTPSFHTNRRNSFFIEQNENNKKQIKQTNENNSIMKQLLDKAAVHIRSIEINDGVYRYSNSAPIKNFYWLNRLFHIKAPPHNVIRFYNLKNIHVFEMIASTKSELASLKVLRGLIQLKVMKLDFSQTNLGRRVKSYDDDDEKEINDEWIVSFPPNIEFIQICDFCNADKYLLNFDECTNIIAIHFKASKMFNPDQILDNQNNIIWPHKSNAIECVLVENYETNWYKYFERTKAPIKYIRYRGLPYQLLGGSKAHQNNWWSKYQIDEESESEYNSNRATVEDDEVELISLTPPSNHKSKDLSLTDSHSNVLDWLDKELSHSASLDEEEEMKTLNTGSALTRKILDRFDGYVIKKEENDRMKNLNIVKINDLMKNRNENGQFCVVLDNKNNDGLLWRLLIESKYFDKEQSFISDKISMYKQWFSMDIAKWIFHLGHWEKEVKLEWEINLDRSLAAQGSPSVSSSPSLVNSLELYQI